MIAAYKALLELLWPLYHTGPAPFYVLSSISFEFRSLDIFVIEHYCTTTYTILELTNF